METAVLMLFWGSAALIAYTYAGFPLLVIFTARFIQRPVRKAEMAPRVSVVIAAWNEQQSIAEKIENVLAVDYPADCLQIIIASDGSDDATVAVAAKYADAHLRVLDLPRRGKIFALIDGVREATGDILIFSDANALLRSNTIRMLVRNFADPKVGGVCGNQIYRKSHKADSSSAGESLYWRFDKWLKEQESRTGSIVSADGAIYAIRHALFQPPASAAVTDDFAISTGVIEQGYRLVFEAEAVVFEETMVSAAREFSRKIRLMNRGLRSVLLRRKLLNPFRFGFYAIELFSHKILRRLVPFFLLVLYGTSVMLSAKGALYVAAAGAQTGFYLLAVLGYALRSFKIGHWKLFYVPFFYCLANAAAFIAVIRLLTGTRIELWQPQRH